jgi:hypothetical protein
VLGNSYYELYYNRSIRTDQTVHNNRPDRVMLDKTTKEAYLIALTMPKSHNLYSIITEKLQKCEGLKEELTRI